MPALNFKIEAYGVEQIANKFRTTQKQARDSKPAMRKILRRIVEIERIIFDSQGRRGGGSWRALSKQWAERKAKRGLDPRILRATGALYRSLTSQQSSRMIKDIDNYTLTFGSSLPYAAIHQFGSDKIPARPYLNFSKNDRDQFVKIVQEHLLLPFGAKR